MRTFILDIIPQIQRFSRKLDDLSSLTNKHWVMLDQTLDKKIVFIFRAKENQLLISENGKIEKGTWEYLGNNALLIDRSDGSFLFKHGFIDENILALKVDGKDEYAVLVDENKFDSKLNTQEAIKSFLENTYVANKTVSLIKSEQKPFVLETVLEDLQDAEFDEKEYPALYEEIKQINSSLISFDKSYCSDIIIAFAKDHSIRADWKTKNPEVADMVVAKKIDLATIENLFEKSQGQIKFRKDFEAFLRRQII